jgi:hypothetical protein
MSTKKEIAKLGKMKLNELQAKFAEVTGETTRSPNKAFLVSRIREALRAAGAAALDAEATVQTETAAVDGKLTRLEVLELQARYLEVVGRPTGSTNKAYMIWSAPCRDWATNHLLALNRLLKCSPVVGGDRRWKGGPSAPPWPAYLGGSGRVGSCAI